MEGGNSAQKGHCSIDRGGNSRYAQLKEELTAGEFIWVKVPGNSWWPGQVVNEDTVSKSIKPRKKSGGLVLVRLYGSYDYLYVDPVKCHSDFIMVLQDNNGSHTEVFKKSLKACRGAHSNALGSKLTESKRPNPSKDKNRANRSQVKQNAAGRKNNLESPSQCNIVKGKMLVPDVSERKSKTKNCYQCPDEDCIAKRKPSRQSSLQSKVMKDIGKSSENVSKHKINSNRIDKSQRRGARENGTPKSLKRSNSSSSGIRDGSQKKLKEDNQIKNLSKQKLESPRASAASSGRSSELSARRIRVMQSLGLVAPNGSPFLSHLKLPLLRSLV